VAHLEVLAALLLLLAIAAQPESRRTVEICVSFARYIHKSAELLRLALHALL